MDQWQNHFCGDKMKVSDLVWSVKEFNNDDKDTLYTCHTDLGRFTILDRMTGFGYRDIESAFTPIKGAMFYLVTGFDLREMPDLDIENARDLLIKNSECSRDLD